MFSDVVISDTSRIDVKTRTKSGKKWEGFTGGVVVFIVDRDDNYLHGTQLHTFGVNGKHVPGAPSDRTDLWNEPLPAGILDKAAGMVIVHLRSPHGRLLDTLKDAAEAAGYIKEVIADGAEIYSIVRGS
jgi:hypothetical protein